MVGPGSTARRSGRSSDPLHPAPARAALDRFGAPGRGLWGGGDSGGGARRTPGPPDQRQCHLRAVEASQLQRCPGPERGAVALGAQPPPWESGGLLARDPRIPAPWAVRGRRARSAAPLAWLALAEWSRVTAAQTHSRPCCPWPAGEHVTGPAGGGWLRRRQQTGARKVRPGRPPRLCPRLPRNDSAGR